MKVFITGAAGFIGAHCFLRLAKSGHQVQGVDNFNSYYDPRLKLDRVKWLEKQLDNVNIQQGDIADSDLTESLIADFKPDIILHLAAQAGVRYSLENPKAYLNSNLAGFLSILEACRKYPIKHLIYASSSSVYGANEKIPYAEGDSVDHPVSLYAATKKSNELMAHCYSHLYSIPTTGLRFFTVYGPWGRPDMSPYLFTKAIRDGQLLKLFNYGNHQRDFTYIDDIVESIERLLPLAPVASEDKSALLSPATSTAPYRILNIGGNRPVEIKQYVATLEQILNKQALTELHPLQAGDVLNTCADTNSLEQLVKFTPEVTLEDGLKQYVDWFNSYYQQLIN